MVSRQEHDLIAAQPGDETTDGRGNWDVRGLTLVRSGGPTLTEQIAAHVSAAIAEGSLPRGGRLPSWRDLAAQLGVARGTVKAAYERLADEGLLVTAGSAGTRVADDAVPRRRSRPDQRMSQPPLIQPASEEQLPFHMGIPSSDGFPAALWSRLHRRAVRETAIPYGYADPRGLPELRAAIASHVAIARGVECSPDQIIVTTGYRSGLGLALQSLDRSGGTGWMEEPGYPVARMALQTAGIEPIPIRVDGEGLVVADGRRLAPDAALAITTPGQQAPTGVTMSAERRRQLLRWASDSGGWIVEDDYLAELHLDGRPAMALAAGSGASRVIHIGTFAKTLAPMVGLGFVVAPPTLAARMIDVAALLRAPPSSSVQLALTWFIRDGHYLRHLRRMRRLYGERRRLLWNAVRALGVDAATVAGLSVVINLAGQLDDIALCEAATSAGLGPGPLSIWYADPTSRRPGLALGIANVRPETVCDYSARLVAVLAGSAHGLGS